MLSTSLYLSVPVDDDVLFGELSLCWTNQRWMRYHRRQWKRECDRWLVVVVIMVMMVEGQRRT